MAPGSHASDNDNEQDNEQGQASDPGTRLFIASRDAAQHDPRGHRDNKRKSKGMT